MRSIITALAIAAALTASAQAQAADKLVPDNATGAAADFKGKPWTEPLTNCAGFHIFVARELKDAGDADGSWKQVTQAGEFITTAATRISEDRGMTFDEAMKGNQPKVLNVVTYLDLEDPPPDKAGWTTFCQDILASYRKAFG